MPESCFFPKMVTSLPEADIPWKGIRGWIFQGEKGQIVFMEAEPPVEENPHSHGDQWEVLLDGEATIYVDGKPHLMTRGDSLFVPAGAVHSGVIHKPIRVIGFFADSHRYLPKRPQ